MPFRIARAIPLTPVLLLAACTAAPPAEAPPRPGDPYDIQAAAPGAAACAPIDAAGQAQGAAATNSARRAAGLAPVAPDPVLARAAGQHACDMARRGRMAHAGSRTTGPSQRVKALGYAPRITAENIAAGPFSLTRVLAEFNASPKHLDNILIPQMRDFGIGSAVGSDGKTVFWAAVYAAPR